MNIVVAGKSKIKWDGVEMAQGMVARIVAKDEVALELHYQFRNFLRMFCGTGITALTNVTSIVPEQPYGEDETTRGAEHRAMEVERNILAENPEADLMSIGIENGVWKMKEGATPEEDVYTDVAVVAIRYKGKTYYGTSEGVVFPTKYVLEAKSIGAGNEVTVGKIIAKHLGCDHANPHKALTHGLIDRVELLARAVLNALVQIG